MFRSISILVFAATSCLGNGLWQAPAPNRGTAHDVTERAEAMFKAARFDDAQRLYSEIAVRDPSDVVAARRLGALALFQNKFSEAESVLLRARSLDPVSKETSTLLAEAYTRRDAFPVAAPFVRTAGHADRARQLESFGTEPPYATSGPDEAVVPFATEDPLPVIQALGPDGSPLVFFIDTGAGELVLDRRVAARLGIVPFGERIGTVAGGEHVSVGRGSLGAITFGATTVRRLPVDIDDLAPLTETFGGRRIDGIVGTVFLYHFLATLDYPARRLVLRKRTAGGQPCSGASVPFVLAGNHFIIARGGIGSLRDMVWLVDTGLADGGFSAPESTLARAGITLDRMRAKPGVGDREEIRFLVPELSLGAIVARDVAGIFEGDFPVGKLLGFRVDGLVSHTFFKPYAMDLDFDGMKLCLRRR